MIRTFFLPAIKLFSRFKYFQVITLMGVLLLVPTMVVFYLYLSHIQHETAEVRKGQTGIEYSRLLKNYLEDLQQFRAIRLAVLNKDTTFQGKEDEKDSELMQDIGEIDHFTEQNGLELGALSKWSFLKYRWMDKDSFYRNQTIEDEIESQTKYIQDILEFMVYIGDSSGLALDAEYASLNLVNGVTKTIPELSEILGQTRALGMLASYQPIDLGKSILFISLQSSLSAKLNDLGHQIEMIDQSMDIQKQGLHSVHDALKQKTTKIITAMESQHENAQVHFESTTEAITNCFTMFESELTMLREIYQNREQDLLNRWYWMLGLSILTLLVTIYGFVAFFLAVTDTVRNLKDTSQAIVSGKLPSSTPLHIREDLLDIGTTFNQITQNLHQQKINVMGQMAAGMAHEIRNPLTSIRGFTQYMKQGIIKDDIDHATFLHYLEICQDEINAIEGLVANFLILARKNEMTVSELEPVHLQTVLHRVHELAKHFVIEKDVFLTFRYDDDNAHVFGVGTHIEQITLNLVKNAIDAVSVGGKISLRTSLDMKAKQAIISVQDNGAGIPASRMQHLFEPFYTTKEKGTGIGLSVCKKLLDEMSGSLALHSEEGFGTTVLVRLPLVEDDQFILAKEQIAWTKET